MRFAALPMILLPGLLLAAGPQQDLATYCRDIYESPALGEFAELRISDAENGKAGAIRFAVVDTQRVEGRIHYWFEVATSGSDRSDTLVAQMLVPGYPFDAEEVRAYVLKLPDRPAMRVPRDLIERLGSAAGSSLGWEEVCRDADDLGAEDIRVPAGAYRVRHLRARSGDQRQGELWLSPEVPFGIVRFVRPRRGRMELVGHGRNARSSIREIPIEVEGPGSPSDGRRGERRPDGRPPSQPVSSRLR